MAGHHRRRASRRSARRPPQLALGRDAGPGPHLRDRHLRDPLHRERSLIKLRCMRRTLHILPLELAPIAHAATLEQRAGACRAALRRLGHTTATLVHADRPRPRPAPGPELPYRDTRISSSGRRAGHGVELIRLAIKWLWEHGELVYLDRSPSMHHEQRSFALDLGRLSRPSSSPPRPSSAPTTASSPPTSALSDRSRPPTSPGGRESAPGA